MNKNYDYKRLTPFKWFVLQNFPFIDEDFDAITNYQLFCKLGEEINKLIFSMNQAGEQVEELTNYVNNFFDNLDVQDEIDNKLDEMAQSGELTDIIAQYLQLAGLLCFNTKADMKNAQNLSNGSFVKTYGTLTYNDGYGNFYKIREILTTDIIDDVNIIALSNYNNLVAELIIDKNITQLNTRINNLNFNTVTDLKNGIFLNGDIANTEGFYEIKDGGKSSYLIREKLENEIPDEITVLSLNNYDNLVAELIYNSEINIMQLGAKRWDGTNEYDNKNVIDKAISLFVNHGGVIIFPIGKFFTSGNHIIDGYGQITIKGLGIAGFNDGTTIEVKNTADYGFWIQNQINSSANLMVSHKIENLHLIGSSSLDDGIIISDHFGCILKDLYITGITTGNAIKLYNYNNFTEGTILENCHIRESLNGIKIERNLESQTATGSFFNTQINHCIMSFDINNSIFINSNQFTSADSDKPISLYEANINLTAWYQDGITNNFIIKNGYSSMLTGNALINVDGLHTSQSLIHNYGSGLLQLKGTINYNNSYGLTNINQTHMIDLIHDDAYVDGYNRPRTAFQGARITNGERIASSYANSVIYSSNWLSNNKMYRLDIFEESGGSFKSNSYLIQTLSVNFAPYIKKLTDVPTMFYPRPKNSYDQGSIHISEGNQFEIYCANIDDTVPMYFTLEEL